MASIPNLVETKYTRSSNMRMASVLKLLLVIVAIAVVATVVIWVTHSASPVEQVQAEQQSVQNYVDGVEAVSHSNAINSSQKTIPQAEKVKHSSDERVSKYRAAAETARDKAVALLKSKSGWIKSGGDTADGKGVVYSKSGTEWGTVFKLEGTLNINVIILYDDMIKKADEVPKWNPSVLHEHIIESLDNSTDVTYNVAASGGGGWISSRDFVYVRHWEKKDGWYVVSSVSVTHPSTPEYPKYVRGQQNPTVIRMREITPEKVQFEWLLNINLKGSLFTSIVNRALSGAMVSYLKDLRAHAADLRTQQ